MKNPDGLWAAFLGFADSLAARASDTVLLAGRLAVGLVFFLSGAGKLMALDAFVKSLANRGVPFSEFWGPVGAATEFIGGYGDHPRPRHALRGCIDRYFRHHRDRDLASLLGGD